ncbi:DUF1501 domain-containing protein [Planctomycetales bacterium ZRK34]|nr:DUF1501 domain-containing protein [Planctomycetales bacterium ZRK34]
MMKLPHDFDPTRLPQTRRQLLQNVGMGLGLTSAAALLGDKAKAAGIINPTAPKPPQYPARAKRVIHLFMNGGPSHVDTFDPKPMLTKLHGKTPPVKKSTERPTGTLFASPFKFRKYGRCGLEVSDLFSRTAQHADDLCVIRSMQANVPNHEPSLMLMNCGDNIFVRPSLGSWVMYGLGTENQNLPGFISMCPGGYPIKQTQNWQAAFLPGVYQGTYIDPKRKAADIIENAKNTWTGPKDQRRQLDLLAKINQQHAEQRAHDAALDARLSSFELAYRMQVEATDAFDIDREPQYIHDMYGTKDNPHGRYYLMTRRLIERGVRFVQLWHGAGQPWDSHDHLEKNHGKLAAECDQPIAALLTDLKQRGLLEDTLVIWGGEFGRTPAVELPKSGSNAGTKTGRDHNHYGFSMWMAGGGVKGGHVHGATDELGWGAAENPMHVHDLHATILHLLGFNHEELTYRYAGRDFRLTDVHGHITHDIVA